jgi:integrase
MAKALTAKSVENIKSDPDKRIERPDGVVPGLYLVVQPSGAKAWALRYRAAGKPVKMTLGRWPMMGLSEARKVAAETLEAVAVGQNPAAEKQQAKIAKAQAEEEDRDKLATLIKQYERRHLSKLKAGAQARDFLDRFVLNEWKHGDHAFPGWADREIHSITKRDVRDLIDAVADTGRLTSANRVLAHLRAFLNWCVDRDILATSPATGIKPATKERVRERFLSDDEIRWFWAACDKVGQPFGPLGKLLLLTGQRRSEVGEITDAEIQGDTWHMASTRTKNGRPHAVPLSQAAKAVLDAVDRIKSKQGYVFTTTGETAVSGFSKAQAAIHTAMKEMAAKEAQDAGKDMPIEIEAWTWHDLRRTCATGLAKLRIPVRVTEAVINHVSGTGGGIVAVYQKHDYADEKREALEAWGNYVMGLVEGRAGNVVQLAAKGAAA